MSMMPAFSPGPCTTSLLRVGSRFRCTRDDLYEQCSLHITLKIPSSVSEGSRPSAVLMRPYSSGVMPCSAMTSGVMADSCVVGIRAASIFACSFPPAKKSVCLSYKEFLSRLFAFAGDQTKRIEDPGCLRGKRLGQRSRGHEREELPLDKEIAEAQVGRLSH